MSTFPVASGLTSHSGTLTPEIWAGKTLVKFYLRTVFGSICNTDYEGEIKNQGDTVHIRTIPDITIRPYTIGQTLQRERPKTENVDLLIDKGQYYAVAIDDIEKLQADINYMEKWTADAGEQMKITIDADVLDNVYADSHASNKGNSAGAIDGNIQMGATGEFITLTKDNILDSIVDMGTVLDEQNIPGTQRWLVLPSIFCGMIKKSDLQDASIAGDAVSVVRNGLIGIIDRFMIYDSNQVNQVTDTVGGTAYSPYNCIFGHPSAITFATQLTKNRIIEANDQFGYYMDGVIAYGYKVIKPDAMGTFYAVKG